MTAALNAHYEQDWYPEMSADSDRIRDEHCVSPAKVMSILNCALSQPGDAKEGGES